MFLELFLKELKHKIIRLLLFFKCYLICQQIKLIQVLALMFHLHLFYFLSSIKFHFYFQFFMNQMNYYLVKVTFLYHYLFDLSHLSIYYFSFIYLRLSDKSKLQKILLRLDQNFQLLVTQLCKFHNPSSKFYKFVCFY